LICIAAVASVTRVTADRVTAFSYSEGKGFSTIAAVCVTTIAAVSVYTVT
jgi:hypothetical protein